MLLAKPQDLEVSHMMQSMRLEDLLYRSERLEESSAKTATKLDAIGWELRELLAQVEELESRLAENNTSR